MSIPEKRGGSLAIPDSHDDLLMQKTPGILSTVRAKDGLISANPVGFLWDGECIRISTLKNRLKVKNLQADPRATLCIMSQNDVMHYIELRCKAELVDDSDKSFFIEQFTYMAGYPPPEGMDPPDVERVTIVLHIEQVSNPSMYGGRFHKDK